MQIDVLDHGYVRLVDVLGNDLSVVNAARVSFDKESKEFSEKDEKLIKFLWEHNHTSPFRHAALSLEVYAPLFVARQWWKHVVGSCHIDDQNGWNESSRRYVTEEPVFYVPEKWLSAPENKKQGSGEPVNDLTNGVFTTRLKSTIQTGVEKYELAMEAGISPEQARLFLPAYGMYVRWRWMVSLHGVLHFISLRTHAGAQYEIQQYAHAVESLVTNNFPNTMKAVYAEV